MCNNLKEKIHRLVPYNQNVEPYSMDLGAG